MTAAAVRLSAASRILAMCAAILFTGGCRTLARCVSAFFSRLGVVHFLLLILLILLLSPEAFNWTVTHRMLQLQSGDSRTQRLYAVSTNLLESLQYAPSILT